MPDAQQNGQPTGLIEPNDLALQNLEFVNREPLTASAPGLVPTVNDRYQHAVISQLGLQTDTADSQLSGHLPVYRLMPSSVSGSAASGAAATSTLLKNPEFVSTQQQVAQNTAAIASIANQNVFLGPWNSTTAYVAGDQVTEGGGYYICILANINQMPPNATYWQLVSTTNTTVFLGAYNGATAYVPGNQVTYQGSYWICIVASTGNAPSTTSTFWTLVGTSVILIGAWNSGTAYVQGNEVTFSGNVYQCILANTNQTPPNATYWQLMGPASLDNVNDGTTRFAATASTLSYVPTSNPLTATDVGSNATINVAAFTMRTSSKGDISINSGSVTALSYSTLYYVYYDDAMLAGGAVTFNVTTTKATALQGTGRFFVGSIYTPAATAPNTVGNNDGGVGAQAGQTAVLLFGTSVSTFSTYLNPNNAIDGSLTTFSEVSVSGGSIGTDNLLLQTASPTSAPWLSFTLNVMSSASFTSGGPVTISVAYSLNGGSSFTNIYSGGTRALTIDSITLPFNQNLALVQVRARYTGSGTGTFDHKLYESWAVGLL